MRYPHRSGYVGDCARNAWNNLCFFSSNYQIAVALNCRLLMVEFATPIRICWCCSYSSYGIRRGSATLTDSRSVRLTLLRTSPINVCGRLPLQTPPPQYYFSKMEPSNQTEDPKKYTLPSDFLSEPAPNLIVQRIDFSKTDVPEYDGLYATIIDNALNEAECNNLVRAAEAHADGKWEQAMVNVGGGKQILISDVRDCGRIIWDDRTVMDKLWSRISSSVPELQSVENSARITGNGPVKRSEKYQMTRLNERMRFLKYGSGQYFRRNSTPRPHLIHPSNKTPQPTKTECT